MEHSIKLENLVSPGRQNFKWFLEGISYLWKTLPCPLVMMANMQTQIKNP